ncbi:peptidoglycan-binding protein [Streptomyces durhamensis]|uniref:peptidoglycan-binding protein n=1 Tax=Streptomyces durhamensis TaxID=68194 RepID=UPI00099C0D7C
MPSPSASASRPSPSATPSPSPSPSAPAQTSRPAAPAAPTTVPAAPRTTPAVAPVLQRGDSGPQVTELQLRLRQLNLYDDRISGVFGAPVQDAVRTYQLARGIQGDTPGVYGPATRKSLEAETTRP